MVMTSALWIQCGDRRGTLTTCVVWCGTIAPHMVPPCLVIGVLCDVIHVKGQCCSTMSTTIQQYM